MYRLDDQYRPSRCPTRSPLAGRHGPRAWWLGPAGDMTGADMVTCSRYEPARCALATERVREVASASPDGQWRRHWAVALWLG